MPVPYHICIRWLVVYKRLWLDQPWEMVWEALHVSKTFQTTVLLLFFRTGDVQSSRVRAPGNRRLPVSPCPWRKLTREMEISLFHDVLDSPSSKLSERALALELEHGVKVSVPTLCRAMRHMRLSCKRGVQHYALDRDEERASLFLQYIASTYGMDQILVGDETAKQIGCLRAWGPMGVQTFVRDKVITRGRSVSTLTYFSSRGFEAWRHETSTFNAIRWQAATDEMLLTEDESGETLASRYLANSVRAASPNDD